MRKVVALLVVVAALLVGASTALVADSPYDSNVVSEQNPFAPERPEALDRTTASVYLVEYEEQRLHNDLLASRDFVLDQHDEVMTNCTAASVEKVDETFRVRLDCRGRIDDAKRFDQPSAVEYTVTYRMTSESVEQLRIQGYPFENRDELRNRSSMS